MEEAAQSEAKAKNPTRTRIRKARAAVVGRLNNAGAPMKDIPKDPPLKQLMKYAVPAVLALLMLRHQRQPDALFRENPAPLWTFVAANAVYWLVAEAITTRCRRKRQYELILRRGAVAFGLLSVLSLMSMFLPYPFSLLPLLAWMLFAPLLAYDWIRTPLVNAIGKVGAMVVRDREVVLDPNNELCTLPVSLTHTQPEQPTAYFAGLALTQLNPTD